MTANRTVVMIGLLFCVSGIPALVYQVAWHA